MFVEFEGPAGPVFISADCVAQISVGSPQRVRGTDTFYHEVHLTYKPGSGAGEGLIDKFTIDYDYLSEWLEHARRTLGVGVRAGERRSGWEQRRATR